MKNVIHLGENSLTHNGEAFDLGAISNIFFKLARTTKTINLIPVARAREASLVICFGRRLVEMHIDENTIFYGITKNREEDIDVVLLIYRELSRATFERRLRLYVNGYRENGYYDWYQARLRPPHTIVIGSRSYDLRSAKAKISNRSLVIEAENNLWTFFTTLFAPKFNLFQDLDILDWILAREFGCELAIYPWKNGVTATGA